ncbi:RBBP9/YdeN family alpha/beta hydrolase [Sphaerotilus sp.]|uniref:RBBP9/YdeN family alpha/beta hydrolase n=1 Tax=Sphaerotilus sp. TaxID=2093942 RepID=UPI0034E2D027
MNTSAAWKACRVLLLPGWLGSGEGHWQTRWAALHGFTLVEQDDWTWPRRGDWMARLDDVLLSDPRPALLVAHSLGCQLVAAWAAHSRHTGRVRGALLVAPPDTERDDMPPQLHNWRPMRRGRLPFAATAVVSSDDPYCAPDRAAGLCVDWGARAVVAGPRGHLNAESGLGDWPDGLALVAALAGALVNAPSVQP